MRGGGCRAVFLCRCLAALFLVGVLIALFARSVHRPPYHDEEAFVPTGPLLLEHRLPYVDYPFEHPPYIAFLYAGLSLVFAERLLAARFLSVLCGWLTVCCVFWIARRAAKAAGPSLATLFAAETVCLLVLSPLFADANGIATNHDPAILFAVLALAVLCWFGPVRNALLLSGIATGLAAGTRIALAPLIPAFLLVITFRGSVVTLRERIRQSCLFGVGVILALVPALAVCAIAPHRAFFGNVTYRLVEVEFRRAVEPQQAILLPEKLRYFTTATVSEPGTLIIGILLIASLVLVRRQSAAVDDGPALAESLSFAAVPFLLVGALTATPAFHQYLYAPLVLALLATSQRLGRAWLREDRCRIHWGSYTIAAAVAVGFGPIGRVGSMFFFEPPLTRNSARDRSTQGFPALPRFLNPTAVVRLRTYPERAWPVRRVC